MTFDEAAFRTFLLTRAGWDPPTVRDALRRCRMMKREGVDLESVTVDGAFAYLANVRDERDTVSRYNNRAKALNAWLSFRDGLAVNPIPLLPEPKPEFRALSEREERTVLGALHRMEPLHRAVVTFELGVGLRPEETHRLDDNQFRLADLTLDIRRPCKGGLKRRIPVPEWVGAGIEEWRAVKPRGKGPDAAALFADDHRGKLQRLHAGSIGRILREEGRRVDVRLNANIARHTVATRLLREGYDLAYVAFYLGHTSTKWTTIYAEVKFEDANRRFRLLPSSRSEFVGPSLSPNQDSDGGIKYGSR